METIVFICNSDFRSLERARIRSTEGWNSLATRSLALVKLFPKLRSDWAKRPLVRLVAQACAPSDRAGVPAGKYSAALSISLRLRAE